MMFIRRAILGVKRLRLLERRPKLKHFDDMTCLVDRLLRLLDNELVSTKQEKNDED